MANTTFTGPVISTNGFQGSLVASEAIVVGSSELLCTANVIIIPTSDPGVAGAIWNDGGTLSVSAG